jgi:hypothetical protein
VSKLAVDVQTGIITAKVGDESNVKVCRGRWTSNSSRSRWVALCTAARILCCSRPTRSSPSEAAPRSNSRNFSRLWELAVSQHAAHLPSAVDRRLSVQR